MASLSGINTIVLKAGYTEGGAEHEEGPLELAASPGMNLVLSERASTQGRDYWTPGSVDVVGTGTGGTTTTAGPIRILKEDALRGKTVDDAYAAGDNAFVHIAKSGDVLQVLVRSGENFEKAVGLGSDPFGQTGKFVVDATNAVVETLERSGGALAADTLVRVRVL